MNCHGSIRLMKCGKQNKGDAAKHRNEQQTIQLLQKPNCNLCNNNTKLNQSVGNHKTTVHEAGFRIN